MTVEERRDNLYRQPAKPLNIDTLREHLGQPGQMADRPGMLAYFEKLVRSEGVAEGAEQERERIRKLASLIDEGFPEPMYLIHPSVLIAPVIIEQLMGRILEAVVNNGDAALRETASVLAPPAEKPKIGKETCKTYSESWCKGQDCGVCQFNIPGMGPAEEKP